MSPFTKVFLISMSSAILAVVIFKYIGHEDAAVIAGGVAGGVAGAISGV